MADRFAAQVDAWTKKAESEMTRVWHAALRELVVEVTKSESEGGNLPVLTGNLRNSVAVSTARVTYDFKRKKFSRSADAVNNAIAGIEVTETAFIGFRAPYAHKIEAETGFIRLAAQRWQAIVNRAVKNKAA